MPGQSKFELYAQVGHLERVARLDHAARDYNMSLIDVHSLSQNYTSYAASIVSKTV
jgi:hypothetical protein